MYLCKHGDGRYFISSPELTAALDRETLRGPVNIGYAMRITHGTGTDTNGEKYRYAQADEWRVIYWPNGGGSQGYVKVQGIGWCVDVNDEMPHEVWILLLAVMDAPLDRTPDGLPVGFMATRACENSGC